MPAKPAPTSPHGSGDTGLDRLMACLNSWLERATQMEMQARQARSMLTISTLTIGGPSLPLWWQPAGAGSG